VGCDPLSCVDCVAMWPRVLVGCGLCGLACWLDLAKALMPSRPRPLPIKVTVVRIVIVRVVVDGAVVVTSVISS
jgi:hypothetical protein